MVLAVNGPLRRAYWRALDCRAAAGPSEEGDLEELVESFYGRRVDVPDRRSTFPSWLPFPVAVVHCDCRRASANTDPGTTEPAALAAT